MNMSKLGGLLNPQLSWRLDFGYDINILLPSGLPGVGGRHTGGERLLSRPETRDRPSV